MGDPMTTYGVPLSRLRVTVAGRDLSPGEIAAAIIPAGFGGVVGLDVDRLARGGMVVAGDAGNAALWGPQWITHPSGLFAYYRNEFGGREVKMLSNDIAAIAAAQLIIAREDGGAAQADTYAAAIMPTPATISATGERTVAPLAPSAVAYRATIAEYVAGTSKPNDLQNITAQASAAPRVGGVGAVPEPVNALRTLEPSGYVAPERVKKARAAASSVAKATVPESKDRKATAARGGLLVLGLALAGLALAAFS